MKKIKIGMLGIGNVASGTYKALEMNCKAIGVSAGVELDIVKILNRRPDVKRAVDVPKEKYVADAYDIINDPQIDIVVELIGGIEPATTYMADAIKNKKHVVTANKAALAVNGKMLQQLAIDNSVMLRFEASVAGGIPIINAVSDPLLSNGFEEVLGILNGTTNYILTKMTEDGADYSEVLKDAQQKGLAESDPSADVSGLDVANKLSILISLLFEKEIPPQDIHTEGITGVTSYDIAFAEEFGYKVKLLGHAKKTDGKLICSVEPTMLPASHPLASVNNEFNAVFIKGNAVDELMFYGKGAGPLPTGSAVLGDVIDIANAVAKGAAHDIQPLLRYDSDLEYTGEGSDCYYIRMTGANRPGVLGNVSSTYGRYGIGIEAVMQRSNSGTANSAVPMIFIVYEVERSVLDKALNELIDKSYVESIDSVMRIQH